MDTNLRQHDQAVSQLERALTLDPNDPSIHSSMSWVLSMCGRPAAGMEYAKSGMRLNPLNPAAYLVRMGLAYLCMGEWQEAAAVTDKALKLSPELRGLGVSVLTSAYARLGYNEEPKATIQTYLQGKPSSLGHPDILMHGLPFKDRKTADALVENMKKAGLVDPQPEYVHASSEDQVTGRDLKAFYYPSKIAGYSTTSLQWSQEFSEHGTVTFRAAGLPGGVDTGRSCQEGDRIWCQFKNYMSGVPYCRTPFKNPRGTHERKDEYLGFIDTQLIKFSRVR